MTTLQNDILEHWTDAPAGRRLIGVSYGPIGFAIRETRP